MPLPPNSTGRVFLDYTDGTYEHTIMARYATSGTPNDAMNTIDAALTAMDTALYTITVLGARHAVQGSNISNAITWTGSQFYGSSTMPAVNAPRQLMWVGKDAQGHRWRVSLFGVNEATPADYRFNQGDVSLIDDTTTVWHDALSNGTIVTVANLPGVVKNYADFNFNSHFEIKRRG